MSVWGASGCAEQERDEPARGDEPGRGRRGFAPEICHGGPAALGVCADRRMAGLAQQRADWFMAETGPEVYRMGAMRGMGARMAVPTYSTTRLRSKPAASLSPAGRVLRAALACHRVLSLHWQERAGTGRLLTAPLGIFVVIYLPCLVCTPITCIRLTGGEREISRTYFSNRCAWAVRERRRECAAAEVCPCP